MVAARELLQRRGTGDDLDQFARNHRLSRAVERQRQLVDHLAGVLAGIVHGAHARRLLRAGALLHREEQQRGERELQIVLDDVGVQRVVRHQLLGGLHNFGGGR